MRLDPHLKKLFVIAGKARAAGIRNGAPAGFADDVLRRLARANEAPEPSLLEFFALRGAAVAAFLGLLILSLQLSTMGSNLGPLKNAAVPCAQLIRSYLP